MVFKKRYILAQEAEERIVSLFRKERNDAAEIFNTAIDACQSIILDMYDNAPDVIEVVRCKDCKYWDTSWKARTEFHYYCPMIDCITGCDFFCADGERRDT